MREEREHLDAIEVWPPERLRRLQLKRLRAVLRYAWENLPFYRRRFQEAGFRPEEVRDFQDFSLKVPTFRKADIIEAMQREGDSRIGIEAVGPHRLTNLVMTSGTMGFHTFAAITDFELSRGAMRAVLREFWMQKMRPGMRVMMLSPGWHYLSLLDSIALTKMRVSCLSPWGTHVPRFAANFLETVRQLQPEYLLTVAPVLYAMLAEAERLGLNPRETFASVQYIASVGEPITPQLRQRLKEELGVKDVFERGGSADGLWGGGECFAHRGHHVFADLFYMEVIDPATGEPLPPGRRGSVVVTNLNLGKSLYIRFDCEDVGEICPEACECGRTHPLIELYDRLANLLRVGGRTLTAYDVRLCLDEVPELCGAPFLVVKSGDDMSRLRVIIRRPRQGDPSALVGHFQALVRKQLGVDAAPEWIEEIPVRWKGRTVMEEEATGGISFPRE